MYISKLQVTILFFVIIIHLYEISISIIKNKAIFNNKILAFIAFFIVTYFLNWHLKIYLIYSISIITITKKNKKIERKREECKLEKYNRRERLKDRNFNNIFKKRNKL